MTNATANATANATYWHDTEGLAHMKLRRLNTLCPPLSGRLRPGMAVLDVGCGPGSITRDVASLVYPGSVIGVDRATNMVTQARTHVNDGDAVKLRFQEADAYALEFPDQTFDLTYSLNLLAWLQDPVTALREQCRVTKSGGMVAAGILDWDGAITYPACPAFAAFLDAMRHLSRQRDDELFVHHMLGQRATAIFDQAGFQRIEIEAFAAATFCVHQGSEFFGDRYQQYRHHMQLDGPYARRLQRLLELGVLTQGTILEAQEELKAWHAHPHAFHMVPTIFAVGHVTHSPE